MFYRLSGVHHTRYEDTRRLWPIPTDRRLVAVLFLLGFRLDRCLRLDALLALGVSNDLGVTNSFERSSIVGVNLFVPLGRTNVGTDLDGAVHNTDVLFVRHDDFL